MGVERLIFIIGPEGNAGGYRHPVLHLLQAEQPSAAVPALQVSAG
jgi:hypothetical protein